MSASSIFQHTGCCGLGQARPLGALSGLLAGGVVLGGLRVAAQGAVSMYFTG